MNNEKKEVVFTPLNTTPTPKRVSLIQLYQKTSRNYKWLNIFKNIVIGVMVALIVRIRVELSINNWYQCAAYYMTTIGLIAYIMTQIDKMLNYILGGSYE